MESLLSFLSSLIEKGELSATWVGAFIGLAGLGVVVFYAVKVVMLITSYFKTPADSLSKDDLRSIQDSLQDDNKQLLKILEEVNSKLRMIEETNENVLYLNRQLETEIERISLLSDRIKDIQHENLQNTNIVQKDLSTLVSDSKAQYTEITRQVQSLQIDLASLQGTIIGLNTSRTRLK